jgi:membrane-associated phospholipid phosphatase
VHRHLRSEGFGGHVEVQRLRRAAYPFHPDLFASSVLDGPHGILAMFGSHLLPQAFPEGSPLHTAYGSGHATVAGACVTMLKWFLTSPRSSRSRSCRTRPIRRSCFHTLLRR